MMRTIRPLAQADIATLQEIDAVAHGTPWSHNLFLDEIANNDRVHLVAECGDELVAHAAAWIDERSCRITNVATAPEHGGCGHGTAVLLQLLRTALASSSIINAQLEVRPANRRAQRMYRRFGFMPVGIERDFYDVPDAQGSSDALIMAVPDVCDERWRKRLDQIQESVASALDKGAAA